MKTDYLQGIILKSSNWPDGKAGNKNSRFVKRINDMPHLVSKIAKELVIRPKPGVSKPIYAKQAKFSHRQNAKRDTEVNDLLNRLRIRSY